MIEPLFEEDGRLSRATLDELELVLVANPPVLERFIDALEELAAEMRGGGRL